MSERFKTMEEVDDYLEKQIQSDGYKCTIDVIQEKNTCLLNFINNLLEENEHLKERLYDFEKRKIIEESEINEDVIPKVKMLRTELFGEKYE